MGPRAGGSIAQALQRHVTECTVWLDATVLCVCVSTAREPVSVAGQLRVKGRNPESHNQRPATFKYLFAVRDDGEDCDKPTREPSAGEAEAGVCREG